jgi:hypothetical protein
MCISYEVGSSRERKTTDTEADRAQKRFAVETVSGECGRQERGEDTADQRVFDRVVDALVPGLHLLAATKLGKTLKKPLAA